MRKTPERIAATGGDDEGFAVLAGKSADGKTVQILISNYQVPANYKPNVMVPPRGIFSGRDAAGHVQSEAPAEPQHHLQK